jgi:hypothetical protein
MVIRPEQIKALSDHMLRGFVDRMMEHVRSSFPAQTASRGDEELRGTIQTATERAETYGVTDEADVQRYLEFEINYGPNFDDLDWASAILKKTGPGAVKMNELDDYNICRLSGGGSL